MKNINFAYKILIIYALAYAYYSSLWGHNLIYSQPLIILISILSGIYFLAHLVRTLFKKSLLGFIPFILFIVIYIIPFDYLSLYLKLRYNFEDYEIVSQLALDNKLELTEYQPEGDEESWLKLPSQYSHLIDSSYDPTIRIKNNADAKPSLCFSQFSVLRGYSKGLVYDPNPTEWTLKRYKHLYKDWYYKFRWKTYFSSDIGDHGYIID